MVFILHQLLESLNRYNDIEAKILADFPKITSNSIEFALIKENMYITVAQFYEFVNKHKLSRTLVVYFDGINVMHTSYNPDTSFISFKIGNPHNVFN
jgi:hypothetical protein